MLGRRLELELTIVAHDELRFMIVKPVGLALVNERLSLGIELFVIGTNTNINRSCQLHTNETTIARRISQHIADVGSGNEGSQTWKVLNMSSVGALGLDTCQLDDVLQEALLRTSRNLVELIQIDEQHLRHSLQHRTLLVEREVVSIAPLQLFGQQRAAEGGFVITLTGNEQRRHRITIATITTFPLSHHRQKPRAEPARPVRIISRNGASQSSDMVLPIPFRMNTPEVVLNRIEVAHFVRFDIAGHILVPNVEARQTSIGGKSIDYSLVHGLPIGMSRIIRTILRVAHHRIIAEHITVFQEVNDVMCLTTYPFFGTQFSAIRFCLCVGSLNDGSQTHFGQGRIVFMMIPNMRKCLFLWYSQ